MKRSRPLGIVITEAEEEIEALKASHRLRCTKARMADLLVEYQRAVKEDGPLSPYAETCHELVLAELR